MNKKQKNSKKLNLREKDPYLAAEKAKYEHPLPSREWIIQVLEDAGVPQKVRALAETLSITEEEFEFFERRLHAMVRDGQVHINRRGFVCMAEKLAMVKCRIEAHKDGFGFAVPLTPFAEGDLVLYERQMRGVMHGDIVTVRPLGLDRRGRREGQVLDIIERAQNKVVGRFYLERGVAVLDPEDKRLTQNIILEPDSVARFAPESGQVVVAEIDSYPENHRPAVAKIIEVLGDYADSGMEIEIAVRKHKLPHRFSEGCLKAAEAVPDKVRPADRKGREDLRGMQLITIDGEHSRDFDDAVFAEKLGRNYRLVVAIADVSHYVQAGDPIDDDARERATSVYFPRRVIPMLPESLSNGICSLNPDVERLCMVCDMVLTFAGNVKEYRFYPAVMKSHARLTYTQVWDWLSNNTPNPYQDNLDTLYKLFKVLQKKRRQRGAMEFESTETEMLFDDDGKIERILPVVRNDAHKLIEECMLAANVCAADYLLKNKHPALFRNHNGPNEEKLATLREQLSLLGLQLGGGSNPQPKHYAELAEKISGRSDRELIQTMLLRSMRQAVYEAENEGHFGLAYEHYVHFTSPIRRYPDLLVHRAIKAVLAGKRYDAPWQEMGAHSSFCERRADDASRDVENWLKTYYMRDKVGEVFEGRITHIANFGIFVTLNDVHIEGMVHVSDLGEDYFNYRPDILAMVGERSSVRFGMGDSVTVRVARADLDTSKIDLVLAEAGKSGTRGGKANTQAAGKNTRRGAGKGKEKASADAEKTAASVKTSAKQAGKGKKAPTGQSRSGSLKAEAQAAGAGKGKAAAGGSKAVQEAVAMADAVVAKAQRKAKAKVKVVPEAAGKAKGKTKAKTKTAAVRPKAAKTQAATGKTRGKKAAAVSETAALQSGSTLKMVNGKLTRVSKPAAEQEASKLVRKGKKK